MAQLPQLPNVQSPGAVRGVIPEGEGAGLRPLDARRELLNRPLHDIAGPGSYQHAALELIRDAVVNDEQLFLRHMPESAALQLLPPGIRSEVLAQRAETMNAFFQSWSESMAMNAKADQDATLQRLLLAKVLGAARAGGHLTQEQAANIGRIAGVEVLDVAAATARVEVAGLAARNLTAADRGRPLRRESSGAFGALQPPSRNRPA